MAKDRSTDPIHASSPDDLRRRSFLRPAILVLLKEHGSHGYELVSRLGDMGFDVVDFGGLYRVLRVMEEEGLIVSSWGEPERGPARRVYGLTEMGEQHLRDAAPALVSQRRAIGDMLERYRNLVQSERRGRRRGRHVLVVEDIDDVRHMLWVLLEQRGWIVDEAPDGEQALERWSKRKADVVVLDHRMPGMSGIEVARRLREDGFEGQIILYSAYLDAALEDEAAVLGVQTLPKADFDELLELFDGKTTNGRARRS